MRDIVLFSLIGLAVGTWGSETPVPSGVTTNQPAVSPVTNLVLDANEQFDAGMQLMREQKFGGAAEAFQRAIQARPIYPDAYNQWGIALVQLGRQSLVPEQRLQFYQQAAGRYSQSAQQNPTNKFTQLLWSDVLMIIGDMPVDGRVRLGCYQGAVEKCRRAAELAPTDWETLNKWGVLLSTKLSDFAVDDNACIQLYKEAAQHFSDASRQARFSSEISPLYLNWGSALVRAARLATSPEEKIQLLTDAISKFEGAARALPNYPVTYANWGNALVARGKLSHLRSDFRDAIDRLNTAISLNPKDSPVYYGLARAYAILGNNVMAIQSLKDLKVSDGSTSLFKDVVNDPDFSSLSQDREFLDLITPPGNRGVPFSNPPLRNLSQ